jgi:hypothetical protein
MSSGEESPKYRIPKLTSPRRTISLTSKLFAVRTSRRAFLCRAEKRRNCSKMVVAAPVPGWTSGKKAGDVVEYHMRKLAHRRTMWWFRGEAMVAGQLVAEAELGAMIADE